MAANDILRLSSKDVERRGTWWWPCLLELENGGRLSSVCALYLMMFVICLCG